MLVKLLNMGVTGKNDRQSKCLEGRRTKSQTIFGQNFSDMLAQLGNSMVPIFVEHSNRQMKFSFRERRKSHVMKVDLALPIAGGVHMLQ